VTSGRRQWKLTGWLALPASLAGNAKSPAKAAGKTEACDATPRAVPPGASAGTEQQASKRKRKA